MIRKINVNDLEHPELQSQRTGEKYSLSAVLTDLLGFRDLFVHHEILPAGRKASGAHYHTRREEMVLVLEGEVRAWCDGACVVLGPGDFAGFPPGERSVHYLENPTSAPARVLVIASNPEGDRVGYA